MIRELIIESVKKATGEKDVGVEFPENEEFGDYSTNIAMKIASRGKGKNPREIADRIVQKLKKDKDFAKVVKKIEVAGEGFINFWLSEEILFRELEKVVRKEDKYGGSDKGKGKKVLIEYSSPNIAKYFGIGHLRSTIIGQALYNLYKFLGSKVVGDNHLGDWGTQFGMIIAQVKKKKLNIKKLSVEDLEKLYIEFNKEAQDNPKLKDEAREWFKKLEKNDTEARRIWQSAKETTLKEFDRIYGLLGVKIDHTYGESFYEDKMPAVISEVRKKGLSKKSKGAEIVEFPSAGSGQALPPAMLLKSDGATTYYTRDLATAKFRVDKWDPDLIIYEVGSDQKLHFKQVFETAKLLSWSKGRGFVHIAHGLIRFKHGKMSTRRGETVKLEEVLEEAIERARKIIDKSETSRGLSKSEREKVAKAVGIGAIKYFDLSHNPESDIVFDWEKMFMLVGNSAPYLQYTFARTQSVLRKVKSKRVKEQESKKDLKLNKEEISVLRSLPRFAEVIEEAKENNTPNLLCNYLFELAKKYNRFYNSHRIIDASAEDKEHSAQIRSFRIGLTGATGQVLKNGLTLLGIETPEKM